MNTLDQIAALTNRVDALLNRLTDLGQENARLAGHIINLESRMHAVEQGRRARQDDHIPLGIEAALKRAAPSLCGSKLTLQDLAERLELPTDRSTKIKLGKHLQALGVKRSRTNESRFYCF